MSHFLCLDDNCIKPSCFKLFQGSIRIAFDSVGPYLHPVQLFLIADYSLFPGRHQLLIGIWMLFRCLYPLRLIGAWQS